MTKRGVVACLAAVLAIGCAEHHGQLDPNGTKHQHDAGVADGGSTHDGNGDAASGATAANGDRDGGGRGKTANDGPSCMVSETTTQIPVANPDKVDMLFMVDNSNSMREEQAALRTQFAHLIQVLTSGDRDGDGTKDFPAAKDLHLGVVTSDMGLLGIDGVDNCDGFGDDGLLQHTPSADPALTGCHQSYPTFLSYVAGKDDPNATANDFACIGTVGTGGCGFEQQLEAALKALWPSVDPMPNPDGSSRAVFLGDATGSGTLGHGDVENVGFLRNDPSEGVSLIAIVVVTDEEDCSSSSTQHFVPPTFLDPNDPLAGQPLNLRCFLNQKNHDGDELYKVERYVNGYKALRPGNENLVVFAAIAGVPPDLVDADHLSQVDFGDAAQRDGFYQAILDDSRMQQVIDPDSMTTPGTGNLIPSCDTATGKAYPPRRIVQVAHQFGANAIVQSICQQDFGPALDAVIGMIGKQLGAVCLPRDLTRDQDGLVSCNVYWELPPPGDAQGSTPTTCEESGWEFLRDPGSAKPHISDAGGAICKVAQLAVKKDDAGKLEPVPTTTDNIEFSQGWFYDDFTSELKTTCTGDTKQRIAFSAKAQPPPGVVVKLDCLNQTSSAPNTDPDAEPSDCSAGSQAGSAEGVGEACTPDFVPASGFDNREAFLGTADDECGGGVCLTYHLQGDPRPSCSPSANSASTCASAADVEQHVYCTCRCNSPDGYATCACPSGFSCVDVLQQGSADVRGGYCVKDGT